MPRRFVRGLVLLPLALLLTSCVSSNIVQVSPNDADQLAPAVNGTLVAWEDYRSGTGAIYDRNMTSSPGPETLIADGGNDQTAPAVSTQDIVWVDNGSAIRAEPSGGGNVITVVSGHTVFDPAVCGTLVVWTDMRNGNPDIYGKDLAGGREFPIATSPATEAYPDCDGGRVVYMSTGAKTGPDISMFDRTTGATTVVSAQPWSEWQPAISGSRVVWQAWPNQPNCCIQVFGVDLSTGAPFTVTTGSLTGNQTLPDISGTVVAWQDDRRGTEDVWYVDLAGGTPSPVAAVNGVEAAGERQTPDVSGRRIVWTQRISSTASWNVYYRDV
jgi:beta propeller repeat protein